MSRLRNIIILGLAIYLILALPMIAYQPTYSVAVSPVVAIPLPNDSIDPNDLYWLSLIVSAEARGETLKGQIAVANVVLNRVSSPLFPNTIKEVIFQPGQFCPVTKGLLKNRPSNSALRAARYALLGMRVVPEDVLFFYNPEITGERNWIRSREISVQIGNHVFATSRGR